MRWALLLVAAFRGQKLATALSFGATAAAFVLFGVLGAIDRAFHVGVSVAGADRIIVRHRASLILPLPASYEAALEAVEGVLDATHATWFGGIYRDPRHYFPQFAVQPAAYRAAYPGLLLSASEAAAWDAQRDAAVVGRATADRFEWSVGDRVSLDASLWPRADGSTTWDFHLVGIYDGSEERVDLTQFLIHYDYFNATRPEATAHRVGWFIVRVADAAVATRVARKIDRHFANSSFETRSEGELAFVQSFVNQVGDVGAALRVVLVAVFGMTLLVTTNAMSRKARSRLGEFALLKALGFDPARVGGLILAEACAVSLPACIGGLSLARVLVASGDPSGGALPGFEFAPQTWGWGLLFALLLTVGAALPAMITVARGPAASLLRDPT